MSPEKPRSPGAAKDNRRASKPLMEKKRRARINDCLVQLKTLVLDTAKTESSRHSKLEKADILEMTLKYLRNLHRQYTAALKCTDPAVMSKYRAGYDECINETTRYLSSIDGLDFNVRNSLLNHLASCMNYNNKSNMAVSTATTQIQPVIAHAQGSAMTIQPLQVQIPTVTTFPVNVANQVAFRLAASNRNDATLNVDCTGGLHRLSNVLTGVRVGNSQNNGEVSFIWSNGNQSSNQIPVIPMYDNTSPMMSQNSTTSSSTSRISVQSESGSPSLDSIGQFYSKSPISVDSKQLCDSVTVKSNVFKKTASPHFIEGCEPAQQNVYPENVNVNYPHNDYIPYYCNDIITGQPIWRPW